MIRLGIRGHDVNSNTYKGVAKIIKDYGFDGVQLAYKKSFKRLMEEKDIIDLKNEFCNTCDILMLGCYFNPVHPNKEILNKEIEYFKLHLKYARFLNTKYVGTETGSLRGDQWSYYPGNHGKKALDDLVTIFKDLAITATKYDSYICLEGGWGNVIHTPKRMYEALKKIDSERIRVIVDLFNFLTIKNYKKRYEILDECFKLFKDKIVIFHLKDFIIEDNKLVQVPLGKGLMDYNLIINKIKKNIDNPILIFENIKNENIKLCFNYISNIINND